MLVTFLCLACDASIVWMSSTNINQIKTEAVKWNTKFVPLPKLFALMVSKTVKLTNSRYLLKWEVSAFCVILLSLPPPHLGKWLFKTINSLWIISNVCYTGTQLFFLLWHSKTMAIWHHISTDNLFSVGIQSLSIHTMLGQIKPFPV